MSAYLDLLGIYSEEELRFLFNTRRHPSVAKNLIGDPPDNFIKHVEYILRSKKDKNYFFILKSQNQYIGYSQINQDDSIFKNTLLRVGFVIHPDFQGRGYGKKIVELTMNQCSRCFPTINNLELEVKKDNKRAIHIYKSFGFKEYKEEDNLISMVRENGSCHNA